MYDMTHPNQMCSIVEYPPVWSDCHDGGVDGQMARPAEPPTRTGV